MPTTPMPDDEEHQGDEPTPATVRVPVGDPDPMTGRYREYVDVEPEAAAHWDARRWVRLS